ncbi:MAG TPA: HDIG domain-containing protein [Syntrophales bacterium]|nr:HDIG domain-containing protein [Syntrophales bacterium]
MIRERLKLSKVTYSIEAAKKLIPAFARHIVFQKWLAAAFLAAVISFLLTSQLHFSYPEYKVGSIAIRDVRSDRDFLLEDKAATAQRKLDAAREMPQVFDYDADTSRRLKSAIARAFQEAESKAAKDDSSGKADVPSRETRNSFENSLGVTLTEGEFSTLQKYRFAAPAADALARIVAAVYSFGFVTNQDFAKQDIENGIVIRDIKTQKERTEKNLKSVRHINLIDSAALKKAADMGAKEDLTRCLVSVCRKLIQPNLTLNSNTTERRRSIRQDEIQPVLLTVLKDEMLIREGQKISPLDRDKLDAFLSAKGERYSSGLSIILGTYLLVLSLSVILFYLARKWITGEEKISDVLFLAIVSVMQVVLMKAGIFISEATNRALPLFSTEACYLAIPFAAGAMLVGVLINRNVALIFAVFSSCLALFLFDNKLDILLFSLLGSTTASYNVERCRKRSSFLKVGLLLGTVNCAVIVALCLLSPPSNILTANTVIMLAMGMTGGAISGIIVAGIAPVFESFFDYTTDTKLLELANLNQPIFQRMILEVPGTYHHSIIVASLAEAAAEAIGANPLLAKVSAYYHDIGKSKKPQYFIENQRSDENRHDKLSPRMSSLIITSHVKNGCELAIKAKLGKTITNIIRQHHGTSLVAYFYEKAKRDKDPSIRALPETDFRYAGPKPQSKEAGLVLLADVVEASSRALSNPTPSRISNLVKERIERVFMDGQLEECEITLRDLHRIAENFTRILNGIFHQRIDYPYPVLQASNGGRKENNANLNRQQAEKNKS